ncbi:MAG: PqqD family protein [Deltaproteobacteria bacterium]|nr:PqqD family protein [Deltaproteobacteria bacterium]MBI3755294.1 PqqD family protein [Deltaproteobacteria bacterium]
MDNVSILENPKLMGLADPFMKINDKVTIVSADGEGLVLNLNTRKTFWVNGSAAFLLELLQENSEGISLSSAKKAVDSHHITSEKEDILSDLVSFFGQMEKIGLISCSEIFGTKASRCFNSKLPKPYLKPIIKEETESKHRQTGGGNASTAAYYGTH